MLDTTTLVPLATQAFARVLAHLDADLDVPAALPEQGKLWARQKAERGRAAVAEALGLEEAELPFLDSAVRDVERTLGRLEDGGALAERNAVIALVRLLSWCETLGQRVPALTLEADVEALASEDLARKQVRSLELIVRSLINESYGDQDQLVERLRVALSDKVVARWQASGDAGDVLSGCTFSELASLFANKQEFERYEELYAETPFLTLLKQRRRTVQAFLEDVRRIRNTLAHHRQISNVQLSLLDLYYEEIVTPVQTAHDEGETRVDPSAYLEVSREDLESYYAGLKEDVRSVKDDLGELRAELTASLGVLQADTAEIKETTRGIDRKVIGIGIGVLLLIGIGVFLALQGDSTQEGAEAAKEASERTEEVVRTVAADTSAGREAAEAAARTATETAARVDEGLASTEAAATRVEEAATGTEEAATRVEEAATGTEEAATRVEAAATGTEEAATRVEEAATDTRAAAEAMAEATEEIVETLETMREGFAALAQQGGIIAEPRRPQEHYHNARLQEARGDIANAMMSYASYMAFQGPDLVDPHLRYQALLEIQRGRPGAREAYFALKKGREGPVWDLAWARLLEGDARETAFTALLEAHPRFAPALHEQSRDVSLARLGSQSMADKRQEKALLEAFLEAHEAGELLPFYLDQSVAAEQLDDARERLAALSAIADEILTNPVTLAATRSNQGWTGILQIADTAKEVFWRRGDDGPFRSTGFVPGVRSHAGLPLPQTAINLGNSGPTILQVKYVDLRGREQGPFEVSFEPERMLFESAKSTIKMMLGQTVAFSAGGSDPAYLYFSNLLAHRVGLKEIRYGVDVETPDSTFPFDPPDPKDPYAFRGTPYVEVPSATRFAVLQVVFFDDEVSEIVRIER